MVFSKAYLYNYNSEKAQKYGRLWSVGYLDVDAGDDIEAPNQWSLSSSLCTKHTASAKTPSRLPVVL